MWSSAKLTASTPHGTLSRLNHAACTLSVYASQPGSPPDHATLDSGWWPALTGQGFHLLGREDGFRHAYPSTCHGLGLRQTPGVLTPYVGLSLADGGQRAWRSGMRWQIVTEAALSLEGTRSEAASGEPPAHDVALRFEARW